MNVGDGGGGSGSVGVCVFATMNATNSYKMFGIAYTLHIITIHNTVWDFHIQSAHLIDAITSI